MSLGETSNMVPPVASHIPYSSIRRLSHRSVRYGDDAGSVIHPTWHATAHLHLITPVGIAPMETPQGLLAIGNRPVDPSCPSPRHDGPYTEDGAPTPKALAAVALLLIYPSRIPVK